MATYTPNLNLGKPEATDAFGNFRQLFNDNMDILDNGGGGGSGGHTIVNESGTDMPAESKLQFTGGVTVTDDSVNGKTVVDISGGGGNVYGAFIDTNRIIKTRTSIPQGTTTYTSTEDCAVVFSIISDSNNSSRVLVDGEMVWEQYDSNGIDQIGNTLYVKKGQVLSFIQTFSGSGYYTVYGLTQGTSGIFTPIIYSDTERVVGVWRDNKPLYQRTFVFETPVAVSYSSFTDTTIDSTDIENIVDNHATHADGTNYGSLIADPTRQSHTKVGLQTNRNGNNANVKTLTIRYTKISDVAGSGNWNTDGVPTVHYSTSEQVIGTFFGKPLYQKSVEIGTVNGGSGKNVAHGIADFKRLVGHECVGYNTAESAWNILSKVDNDASYQREFKVNATNITIGNSANSQTFTDVVATIRYTKVTD